MAYHDHLVGLIGKEVQVGRGGPDTTQGKLLSVQNDYLVLQAQDGSGVVYVNTSHLKSITEVTGGDSNNYYSSTTPRYYTSSSFNSLLGHLKHKFVQINRGGPDKIEGFVADTAKDYLLVLVDKEMVRVPTYHLKSVNVIDLNAKKDNNNDGSGNKSSSDKSSSKKDSSKKSSSKKSKSKK